MKSLNIKFNTQESAEFIKTLRSKVNLYFKEKNISKYANFNMKFKTAFMLCLYFAPFILMLAGLITNVWIMLLMYVLMGFGMSGIGLSIMHDANHRSYSRNQTVNNVLGFLINFIGGYHMNWKVQHNVLHHSYTNVHDHDEDIKNGLMRFSPNQPRKKFMRFQAFYAPFFYSLMSIYWLLGKDFAQVLRYGKKKLWEPQGFTTKKAMIQVVIHKTWYIALMIVLPIIVMPFAWWQIIIGFLIMHFICGEVLALIFQPAHVIEETDFFKLDETGTIENNWAIHQMRTTANFAQGARLFSWFVGGLNFQIEHHLFPNICHVHYRNISKIVKETAKDFNLPYHSHKTFLNALGSHFRMLHRLGTGSYDLAKANA